MIQNINWKLVAACDGYRSLRKAYERDVQKANKSRQRGHRPMRDKAEFTRQFRFVINRALHYAHYWNQGDLTEALIHVLNSWERKRGYWWLGFYQKHNKPLLFPNHSRVTNKPAATRRYFKKQIKQRWYTNKQGRQIILEHTQRNAVDNRKLAGKKPRWTKSEREHYKKWGWK